MDLKIFSNLSVELKSTIGDLNAWKTIKSPQLYLFILQK